MNKITELLREHGRRSVRVKLGRQTFLCLANTNEEAKHLTNYTLQRYYDFISDTHLREEMLQEILHTSLIGDIDHVIETTDSYLKAGCSFNEMRLIGIRTLDQATTMMAAFADKVMPSFR
jgi:alkanesulfonate monooxygenase SsuD/methylene tetrahydromethanopterin reductase-like flavin-dependent oxidoreductase (luciferase family)